MEESNPWPTFVDAFSTVLCIFIFLMLVFVLNSMLTMYESAKKHYVPETPSATYTAKGLPEQKALPKPVESQKNMSKSAENVPENNSTDVAATGGKQSPAQNEEQKENQTVITLAQQAGTPVQSANGKFDVQKENPAYEIKGNQFIIHFKKMEQGYSPEIIDKLNEWLKADNKAASVNVYTNVEKSISVSDAMRLAYQRGIILLKIVKETEANQDVAISVINDAAVMNNSAVITKTE